MECPLEGRTSEKKKSILWSDLYFRKVYNRQNNSLVSTNNMVVVARIRRIVLREKKV